MTPVYTAHERAALERLVRAALEGGEDVMRTLGALAAARAADADEMMAQTRAARAIERWNPEMGLYLSSGYANHLANCLLRWRGLLAIEGALA